MRPIQFHPLSALAGCAILGLVLLVAGAVQVPGSARQSPFGAIGITVDGTVQVEGIPTPSQMMRVVEGTPFTVPSGKAFVATGVAANKFQGLVPPEEIGIEVRFEGQKVLGRSLKWTQVFSNEGSVALGESAIPPGLVSGPPALLRGHPLVLFQARSACARYSPRAWCGAPAGDTSPAPQTGSARSKS